MKKCGIEAVFWKSFSSRIERAVMGAIAQEGMEQAKSRMCEGNVNKARTGRVTAKTPSYGYKLVDSAGQQGTVEARRETHYAIDERKVVVIQRMYNAIANEGYSAHKLVIELDRLAEIDPVYKPSRSQHWSERQLVKILRNPVYKGDFIANRYYITSTIVTDTRGQLKKKIEAHKRPADEWIHVTVPAIVSVDTWNLAQRNLSRNKNLASKNKVNHYLLSGLIVCATCGYHYHGCTQKPRPQKRQINPCQRYYCSKVYQTPAIRKEHPCKQPSILCKKLDQAVWEVITGALLTPDLLAKAIDAHYSTEQTVALRDQIDYMKP
jgi:site-specific DNA recombinase